MVTHKKPQRLSRSNFWRIRNQGLCSSMESSPKNVRSLPVRRDLPNPPPTIEENKGSDAKTPKRKRVRMPSVPENKRHENSLEFEEKLPRSDEKVSESPISTLPKLGGRGGGTSSRRALAALAGRQPDEFADVHKRRQPVQLDLNLMQLQAFEAVMLEYAFPEIQESTRRDHRYGGSTSNPIGGKGYSPARLGQPGNDVSSSMNSPSSPTSSRQVLRIPDNFPVHLPGIRLQNVNPLVVTPQFQPAPQNSPAGSNSTLSTPTPSPAGRVKVTGVVRLGTAVVDNANQVDEDKKVDVSDVKMVFEAERGNNVAKGSGPENSLPSALLEIAHFYISSPSECSLHISPISDPKDRRDLSNNKGDVDL